MKEKKEDKFFTGLFNISGILLMTMTLIIFLQVVARYVFHNSLSWSEEIGRYLFVWITFIGAALAIPRKAHVSLDSFVKKLPPKAQNFFHLFSYLIMLFFGFIIIKAGIPMLNLGKKQVSAALQLPMIYIYLIIPFSGAIMVYYLLKDIADHLRFKGDDIK